MELDEAPFSYNDRIYVPMRAIFEGLGGTVDWNSEAGEAYGTVDNTEVRFRIGVNVFVVNGKEEVKDCAPILKDGRTYVPVRFISESVGGVVWWNEEEQMVYVNRFSDGSGMVLNK